MNGVKIAAKQDIKSASPFDLSVDGESPLWMCNLQKTPKHFGIVKIHINSLASFTARTVLSVDHGYLETPSFITAWFTPTGNKPGFADNRIYGIGTLELGTTSGPLPFHAVVNRKQFRIIVDNSANSMAVTNAYAEIKYYIFASPLSRPITT